MKYTHYLYKLPSGHAIVTPHGKAITEAEYKEYFEIISKWLEETRADIYDEIKPYTINQKNCGEMLNKMFETYLRPDQRLSVRYFLDKRTLAFIYVVSYFIQKENKEIVDPNLSHVMGHALLRWLPIVELIEHYLEYATRNYLSDYVVLTNMYCPNYGHHDYGFKKDVNKAFVYATNLAINQPKPHILNDFDYAYARALYELDHENAEYCIEIIDEKLNKYNIESDSYHAYVLLDYLILELEIASKTKCININLDLNYIEEIITKHANFIYKSTGYYWLAQCYITAKNNDRNVQKAIELLTKIDEPDLYKKAAIKIADLYLNSPDIAHDATEAFSILKIANMQANLSEYARDMNKDEMSFNMKLAHDAQTKQRYISFIRNLTGCQIKDFNLDEVKVTLRMNLLTEEYEYLMNYFEANEEFDNEKMRPIFKKLRHPNRSKQLLEKCERT